MKKFKFFLASLAMMLVLCGGGVVFTGCSSDDDISDPTPVERPNGDKTTGGESTGNKPTGGNATGGESSGGDTTGSETTGGNTTGGESTGEEETGGETTVEVAPLYIVGLAPDSARLPFKVISDTEQEFTFMYYHGYLINTGLECGSWSNTPGQIAFKITKTGDDHDWSVDWGGVQDNADGSYASVATVLSINATEYTALNMRGSTAAPSCPGNVLVYDLVEGARYTLSVNFNVATNYIGVKIVREVATGGETAGGEKPEESDLSAKIQSCEFKGGFNGWIGGYSCENFKDGVLEIKGLVNKQGGADFWCIIESFDYSYMWGGATIECENKVGNYGEKVSLVYGADSQVHITGLAPNAKFDIKITTEGGKVYVAVKVTEVGMEDTRSNIEAFIEDTYIKGMIASGSWDYKVYASSVVYANDKKSITIKYGPFPKFDANNEWLLVSESVYYSSVYYRSCKFCFVDVEEKLVVDSGSGKNNEITDVTFDEAFYYIVVRATIDSKGNIDEVFAKIEPTNDSKIPYLLNLVITIPDTGNYKASTLTIKNMPTPQEQEDTFPVDGSLFTWDGGEPSYAVYNADKGVYEVTATGLDNSSWIAEQSPFRDNYPEGADTSAILLVNLEEVWCCFKDGGSYTFDYRDCK